MSQDDQDLLLEHMTWQEAKAAQEAGRALIIPIGAIEAHGPHLLLATDAIVAFELPPGGQAARRGCRARHVLHRPGRHRERRRRAEPRSTGLTGQTLIGVVHDAASEFFRNGSPHRVLNGHYENATPVYEALTEAIEPYRQTCKAILVNWWEQVRPEDMEPIFVEEFPGSEAEHAGVAENCDGGAPHLCARP